MTAADAADDLAPTEKREGGVSERSRGVALGLAVIGGMFGLHRFYTGRAASGVCMCLTLGGLGIWYLYDIVVIAAGRSEEHTSELPSLAYLVCRLLLVKKKKY